MLVCEVIIVSRPLQLSAQHTSTRRVIERNQGHPKSRFRAALTSEWLAYYCSLFYVFVMIVCVNVSVLWHYKIDLAMPIKAF